MLRKAVKFKDVVSLHFVQSSIEHRSFVPNWSHEDWKLLGEVVDLLNPTIEVIKALEGDTFPTQNLILVTMFQLFKQIEKKKQLLNEQKLEDCFFFSVMLNFEFTLKSIYYELPQETLIAATLDPRFKSLSHIPKSEHAEAWSCLEAEYYSPEFFGMHLKKPENAPN